MLLTPKTYVKYFLSLILIFISYHLLVWFFFTSQIFQPKDGTCIGDMGRMSYQISMLHNRELKYTLAKNHLYKDNYTDQKIDIITIGDSFSRGGGSGENPYYQDFLATNLNVNVLNIAPFHTYTSLETVIGLYNTGYLAKIKPKSIIVESVERIIPTRYARDINFNIKDVKAIPQEKALEIKYLSVDMINTANFKLPYYTFKYFYKNNAQKAVYKLNLNKELFSINNGKKILIYYRDISLIGQFTPNNINKVNDNFNKVAKLLSNLNIKLYFLPPPDKYDLYYDFIQNNTLPKNPFFELIRPLKKDYIFIDTKKILLPLLENGVKDLYWIDDTHWSQKASSAISKSAIFKVIKP